ncbi:MAG: hypothetical protein ACE5IG_08065 [Dehalococcoidia bacterium]
MTWLYRLYGWMMDTPGAFLRMAALSALLFAVGMAVPILLERLHTFTSVSGEVFYGFVAGVSLVVVFNVEVLLIGIGYTDWKVRQRQRRAT